MILACLAVLPAFAQSAPAAPYAISNSEIENGVEVLTISYQAPDSPSPTGAFLVRPTSGRAGSAILYLHLFPGSKKEFLQEAKAMAAKGIVCLLPDGRVPWSLPWNGSEGDLGKGREQVAECRAGVGILRNEPGIAKGRIVIVGHDYGAMFGLDLMAEDPEILGGAFLAFAPTYSKWITYFHSRDSLTLDEYDQVVRSLDPLTVLPRIGGRPLFLQFSDSDRYVSQNDVETIRKVADAGAVLDVVEESGTNHENLQKKGASSRLAWLDKMLQTP